MASSKGDSSKRQTAGKLRIQLKGKKSKAASEDDISGESDEEMSTENGAPQKSSEGAKSQGDGPDKKKKEVPARIDTSVLDNVGCTACGRQLNPYKYGAFQKHPDLKVLICKKCEKFLSSGEISKDKDGSDEQCRWCGQGGRLVVCDKCSKAFCKSCIMRNFNRSEFNNINDSKSWECYMCDNSPLQSLRESYRKVRDTLKALQAKDKAKAAAASSSTNGTPRSKDSTKSAQAVNKSGAGISGVEGDADSMLSVRDCELSGNQMSKLVDQLSVATNTFRDMLRALRSQFEGQGEDAGDESPLKIQFALRKSMSSQDRENRCSKMLSMGLNTYVRSLKKILVGHKASSGSQVEATATGNKEKDKELLTPEESGAPQSQVEATTPGKKGRDKELSSSEESTAVLSARASRSTSQVEATTPGKKGRDRELSSPEESTATLSARASRSKSQVEATTPGHKEKDTELSSPEESAAPLSNRSRLRGVGVSSEVNAGSKLSERTTASSVNSGSEEEEESTSGKTQSSSSKNAKSKRSSEKPSEDQRDESKQSTTERRQRLPRGAKKRTEDSESVVGDSSSSDNERNNEKISEKSKEKRDEDLAAKNDLLDMLDDDNEDDSGGEEREDLGDKNNSKANKSDEEIGNDLAAKKLLLEMAENSDDSDDDKEEEEEVDLAAKNDLLEMADDDDEEDDGLDGGTKENNLTYQGKKSNQKEKSEDTGRSPTKEKVCEAKLKEKDGTDNQSKKGIKSKVLESSDENEEGEAEKKGKKSLKKGSKTNVEESESLGSLSDSELLSEEDVSKNKNVSSSKRKKLSQCSDSDESPKKTVQKKAKLAKSSNDGTKTDEDTISEKEKTKSGSTKIHKGKKNDPAPDPITESKNKTDTESDSDQKDGKKDSEKKLTKTKKLTKKASSSPPKKKSLSDEDVCLISEGDSSDLLFSSDDDDAQLVTSAKDRKTPRTKSADSEEKQPEKGKPVEKKEMKAKPEKTNAAQKKNEKKTDKDHESETSDALKKNEKKNNKDDESDTQKSKSAKAQNGGVAAKGGKEKAKEVSEPKVNGRSTRGSKKEEAEEEDDSDKEIDRFSKLPTLRKRKAKDMEEDGAGADIKDGEDETKKAAAKKQKPGPKSTKAGQKGDVFDDLSSDDECGDKADEEEVEEDEDDLPPVTFSVGPEEEEGMSGVENGKDKKDSESDISDKDEKEDASSSDVEDSDDMSKRKSLRGRKAADKKDKKGDEDGEEDKKDAGDDADDENPKKKKQIKSKLLDENLSDSDDSVIGPKKKKKGKEEEAYKADDSSSGSSLPSDSLEEEDDDSEDDSDFEDDDGSKKKKKGKKKKGKKKRGKGKKGVSEDDDEEEEEEESDGKKKGKGKKRRRIKKVDGSLDEEAEKDEDDDDDEKNKSGKRKDIRKVLSNKKLEDTTRAAAKAEEKRRKRIAAKQREFNIETITDKNNPMDVPITTKLVLEPGKEEGDPPIVQVNLKLVRKLKPHQIEAVQFMWDCMYESVKRTKKEEGAGCILAHCMGLGKTLSVVSFAHTILSHGDILKQKTVLVVSPLNTVLNWQNEWTIWLDEEDQVDVWELASCKQNPARAQTLKDWHENGGVMIIGYEMYRNLSQGSRCKNKRQKKIFYETLVNPGPDVVVCDEGHILKNEASSISKAMNQMRTRRRVVLTGTPLQNNLNEYHCMVSFVKPNLLGTRKEFNNRFISPIQNGQCTNSTSRDVKVMKARAHVLHEMLAGCIQRRDYSALTKFLPPKQEYVMSVRLTNVQIDLYNKYLELSGQGVDGVYNNRGARLFQDYQNLMKIWTHPWVLKLAEIRDELKAKYDDEDSFIDEESDQERSFSSSNSSESSEDEKIILSDSGGEGPSTGPNSKKGTRRTRAKARRKQGEDSDPEEVIAEWKSKTRNGQEIEEEDTGPKSVTKEWWAQYVKEEDEKKLELSNKLFLLFEILKMCEEIGDKVLIFSQSILSLNIIESFLETIDNKFQEECDKMPGDVKEEDGFGRSWTKNLDYYRMDGSTSAQRRQEWASSFNDIDNYRTRLFLISTKAGGLGINLVAANRVIIFDASWNPSHDVQSIFRVYRFGQTKPCYIYRFLAQGCMEEKIYERQVMKLSLSQRVVDEHQIERHFSVNDLKELYNFRPDKWDDGTEKPTLALPKDPLLAEILTTNKHCVSAFHEHDSLLENQIEQTLTEEEKKAAWEEYENEKKGIIVRGPGMERTATWPMMAAAQILSREQITATVLGLRQQLPDVSEEQFQLNVQHALRRQVQLKQEEMRRMEMLHQQEVTYMNMIRYQAQQSNLPYEEVRQQMEPWIQMQRLRTMQMMGGGNLSQAQSMQALLGGASSLSGASSAARASTQPISNKPEEAIDLDESVE